MARIHVIVKDQGVGMLAAKLCERLAKGVALPEVPIERCRQHENLTGAARGFIVEHSGETMFTGIFAGMHDETSQAHPRREPQNARHRFSQRIGLRLSAGPVRLTRPQVARQDERSHAALSRPPTRSYFTMVASTSTMARTASSAVMSEIS